MKAIKSVINRIKAIVADVKTFLKGLVYDRHEIPSLTDTTYLVHMAVGWCLVIYTVLVYFPGIDWRLFAVLIGYLAAMMILKTVKTFTVNWRDIKLSFESQKEKKEEES